MLFKYIVAAVMTNQLKEVERVTRESEFFLPDCTMRFLMDANLTDLRQASSPPSLPLS